MKKSDIKILPKHFDEYIQLVDDIELIESMKESIEFRKFIDISNLNSMADFSYATGKWTIKDILQHIIDAERILSYRALRFARNDATELPGFDEPEYAKYATANKRTIDDLLLELSVVRNSSILMFQNFNDEMLQREGVCFDCKINVLGLGLSIVGHQYHHFNVIKTKYFNESNRPD